MVRPVLFSFVLLVVHDSAYLPVLRGAVALMSSRTVFAAFRTADLRPGEIFVFLQAVHDGVGQLVDFDCLYSHRATFLRVP